MRRSILLLAASATLCAASAHAAPFTFTTDPFAGSTALATPGRQVVGGEPSISFATAADQFGFSTAFFSLGSIRFANGLVETLPTDANVVVLRTFDNDANAATAFGAGNAATLIANQVTTPGAGLFIYFNSGLDLARLVYSTDLNDATADLKILARMTNLAGATGRADMATFTEANFALLSPVPEPASFGLLGAGLLLMGHMAQRRIRRQGSMG